MPRHAQGQMYENRSKRTGEITSFGVRFRHGGKRHYVGLMAMTRKEAEIEMADLVADVRRGIWIAPELRAPEQEPRVVPTFAEFASEWFHGRVADGLGEKGQKDILWRLGHLRHLGPLRLDEITVERVDQYRRAKVKEGTISAGSINKTISILAAVLEVACEYEHIARNLEVYAKAMASGDGERDRLRALVDGTKWQEMGKTEDAAGSEAPNEAVPEGAETAH